MSGSAADAALAAALERALPGPLRIRARRDSPFASSFPLAELDVEAGDGSRHALIWKDLTPASLLPGARRTRGGAPAPDPARELRAYALLESADLGTPRRVAALEERERTWLFLEAVPGSRLEHVGDEAAWHATARWLAHSHGVLGARLPAAFPPAWDPPDLGALLAREPRAAALAPALEVARAVLARAPTSVIHGELYPANVLIGDGGRVCVLDWETIARGPATLDLAALTAGRWDEPGEPLASAYREALPEPPPAAAFQAELDAARLVTAAGWLARPAAWSPPPEQARDWLADARTVAERIAGAAA
jgi:Ser/Thr protein kinase RdoA (MazF antagonist)